MFGPDARVPERPERPEWQQGIDYPPQRPVWADGRISRDNIDNRVTEYRQSLGLPPSGHRGRATGKETIQQKQAFNNEVYQWSQEAPDYNTFMSGYAQIARKHGINDHYFVKEWAPASQTVPGLENLQEDQDFLVPVSYYSPEEVAQMPPEQLDQTVTNNAGRFNDADTFYGSEIARAVWADDPGRDQHREGPNLFHMSSRGWEDSERDDWINSPPSQQFERARNRPDYAASTIEREVQQDVDSITPGWQDYALGAFTAGTTGAILGPLAGMSGVALPGTLAGAGTGAFTSWTQDQDPLTGALMGGAGGFVLGDLGVANWVKEKAKGILGFEPTSDSQAVQAIAANEGISPEQVVQDANQAVHGDPFATSGADSLGQPTAGFNYDWTTGQLVSDTGGGLAEATLPIGSVAPAMAGAGLQPGPSPGTFIEPNTGQVYTEQELINQTLPGADQFTGMGGPGFGGTESQPGPGGSRTQAQASGEGMTLGDMLRGGAGIVSGIGGVADYFLRRGDADDVRQAMADAAAQADPFSGRREQFGDELVDWMGEDRGLAPLSTERRDQPLDFWAANPFDRRPDAPDRMDPIDWQAQREFDPVADLEGFMTDPEAFESSPGYQFRLGEGYQGLERQLARGGQRFGGQALIEAQRYGQDMASQEYQNEFQRRLAMEQFERQQFEEEMQRYGLEYGREFDRYLNELGTEYDIYSQDLDRYGRQFGLEHTRGLAEREQQQQQDQMEFGRLAQLSGANLNPAEAANLALQGPLRGIQMEQQGRRNLTGGLANIMFGVGQLY